MRKLYFLLVVSLLTAFSLAAQDRTITGTVTDSEGVGLPGVNVVVQGTTVGSVTSGTGTYSVNVPDGYNTLVFSFIGFASQVRELTAAKILNIEMGADAGLLDEVIVTALGTERNSREIVYANQSVGAEELMTTSSKNTLEALRGKTAGVKITTGSGSVGSSSRIVLRGEASLTGNNNALIVVDGIPIDNDGTFGGAEEGEAGYADYGNRFNDINPEDIESVTVLKGASATSLYGSRGASGVLLITTKKGAKGKPQISFNSTASVEQAYVLLQRQDQYGQGLINPDGSNSLDSGENFSWGPAFDGVVRPWTSPIDTDDDGSIEYLSRPYSKVDNQLRNFFRLGRTNTNSIALSGGNEAMTYRVSYGNTYQRGILENTDYTRNNFGLAASAKLTERLSSEFSVTYANSLTNTAQEGSRAFEGQNPYSNAVQAPVNIPYNELRDYNNPFHNFDGFYGSYTVNPYFVLGESINEGKVNNLLGSMYLNYKVAEGLNINTRVGTNIVGTDITEATPNFAYSDHLIWGDNLSLVPRDGRQVSSGSYVRDEINSRNIDWTTKADYERMLGSNGDFSLNASIGFNMFDRTVNRTTASTMGGLIVPGVYNLANSEQQAISTQNDSRYRILGLLGTAALGWKNKLFLEYSARNDWSSTLPTENQSFFYHGIGVSAIITDFLKIDKNTLTFAKARASYGTTGKDAGLYLLNSVFFGNPVLIDYGDIYPITAPLNGQTGFTTGSLIGNPNLRPELTKTFELGLDFGFLQDRIEVQYTFYSSKHNDQIVEVSLPATSGYGVNALNVGQISNRGHELGLFLKPIYNRNGFKWTMNMTFAKNTNVVDKISEETDELVIWSSGRGVTLVAEEGQPFGVFKGQAQKFDPNGNPVVNANGTLAYTDEVQTLGNVQPDWIAGIGSSIGWKNLSFGFLFDFKKGNEFFSLTKSATEFNGSAITTLLGDRQPFVLENSVQEVIDEDTGEVTGYVANEKETLADVFLFDGNYSRNVLDGSFIKLRELTLNYDLPLGKANKLGVDRVSIGVFAKNVKFWLPEENSFADPEVNGPETTQGNVQGIETTQTPPARSIGVSLNVKF